VTACLLAEVRQIDRRLIDGPLGVEVVLELALHFGIAGLGSAAAVAARQGADVGARGRMAIGIDEGGRVGVGIEIAVEKGGVARGAVRGIQARERAQSRAIGAGAEVIQVGSSARRLEDPALVAPRCRQGARDRGDEIAIGVVGEGVADDPGRTKGGGGVAVQVGQQVAEVAPGACRDPIAYGIDGAHGGCRTRRDGDDRVARAKVGVGRGRVGADRLARMATEGIEGEARGRSRCARYGGQSIGDVIGIGDRGWGGRLRGRCRTAARIRCVAGAIEGGHGIGVR